MKRNRLTKRGFSNLLFVLTISLAVIAVKGVRAESSPRSDYEGIVDGIMKSIERNPSEAFELWMKLGRTSYEYGRLKEAVNAYRSCLNNFPPNSESPKAMYYIAFINHYLLHNYPAAVEEYRRLLSFSNGEPGFGRGPIRGNDFFTRNIPAEITKANVARLERLIAEEARYSTIMAHGDKEQALPAMKAMAAAYRLEADFDRSNRSLPSNRRRHPGNGNRRRGAL